MASCGACARTLPEGAKFCPFCGVEVVATAAEERRVITVLFADVVGYTGLSEHLDPERVKRLLDGAFERLIADIESHGGRVDKLLGDGILALFGAPVAHEDDPDRAIRAALRMHQSLIEFAASGDLANPFELRIGINTGEVVVGRVGGTDGYTAMGDVVNVASRLQALAAPGEIFIGDATATIASPEILREAVDEFEVRGREQTERVWRVTGLQRGAPATGLRSDLPFVGRTVQRELLSSFMKMVANGSSAVVAVSGEPGAGKTRLIAEALRSFPGTQAVVFAGVCAPYGETNVWSPIASALFSRMDIDGNLSPDGLRQVSRAKGIEVYGFDGDDPALDWFVEAVLHLTGKPSKLDQVPPAQARETLFRLIVEGLRRRSRIGPVIIWIDDLQWADSLLIDLLHRITRSLVDRPVLVITAQRDDAGIDWPPANDHPVTVQIPLDPLTRAEADTLVQAVLGRPSSDALADRLFERSGGNPLFLTELAELAASDDDTTVLPSSLRALIAARLDRLPSSVRAMLDNAAVLGSGSPVSALEMFASELGQTFSTDDLAVLTADGFFEVDDGWWRFRSDVVREVAYNTLTKAVRAERHAGTAAVMAGIAGMPIEQVAHHLATAAELVAEVGPVPQVRSTIRVEAIDLLTEAAQRSLDIGAFNQARRYTTRAIDLDPEDATLQRKLLLVRAMAATERREANEATADAERVLALALEAKDRRDEGLARRLLGTLAQISGDLATARRQLDCSIEILRDLGDDAELAKSLADRGLVEVFGGSLTKADEVLLLAETLAAELGDRRSTAWVREHQAWVAFLSGDVELAEARLNTAAALFEELGDRAGRSWSQGLRAYLYYFQRKLPEAEALAAQVRKESVELGERWAPAMMDSLVAAIRLWSGRFAEAEELSRRALVEFRDLGDRFGMVQALAPRIRAQVALGQSHAAKQGLEEALVLSDSFGDLAFPAMAAAGAAVHMGLGQRGVILGESALERSLAMGTTDAEVRVTLALAQCQVGRAEEALALLLEVETDTPYALAVRALANAMIGAAEVAVADADRVIADAGSSYLDRVIADIAAAGAHLVLDDRPAATARIAQAANTANAAGDAVAQSIAHHADSLLSGQAHHQHGDLGPGWRRVLAELIAAPVPGTTA